MALTFSHSGVKYILDRLLQRQDENSEVQKMREKLIRREVQRQESLQAFKNAGVRDAEDPVRVNSSLKRHASKLGEMGL